MWYKLKRIMMRPNGVEKQVRPDNRWQPWVNTILYIPMENDLLDYSWNNISITVNWVSLGTTGGVSAWYWANWEGTARYLQLGNGVASHISDTPFTVSCWTNRSWEYASGVHWTTVGMFGMYQSWPFRWTCVALNPDNWWQSERLWAWWISSYVYSLANEWTLMTLVMSSSKSELYKNGNLIWSVSWNWNKTFSNFCVWCDWYDSDWTKYRHWRWYLSNFILEDKERTAQEISDYYDQTKSNYWL